VDILTISLDSAVPEEHDKFRGMPGAFEKAMQAIRLTLDMGMNVTIGAVASHHNIRSKGLVDLIELAHDLNVIIFLALAAPLGEWEGNTGAMLTEADRAHLNHLTNKYPLLRTDFDANFVHRGCGAVKEILYITPYGDVLPCPFLHISLGNAFDESLKAIRAKALNNPYFKHYHGLCLAAEDIEFIEKHPGAFYSNGEVKRF
jgi:MoaA/NifB/PqqE/SkfB family radical SAM enzyme